jgi:protein O-mannosyl-transferase
MSHSTLLMITGSIKSNSVVNGNLPWTEVFYRDFWSTPMTDIQSHKSFRPLTSLTFRLNWILADYMYGKDNKEDFTYGFHIVNVVLHGLVSGLVTEAASFVFGIGRVRPLTAPSAKSSYYTSSIQAQFITGCLFGLHPVHAESVSNLTSRGELLMATFFLLAFISYAYALPQANQSANMETRAKVTQRVGSRKAVLLMYIAPWFCMTCSMFCKEQGATTLMALVVYDFLQHFTSVQDFVGQMTQTSIYNAATSQAWPWIMRTTILAVQTVVICAWRYWLNGETRPDFIYDQNPAGFSEDRFTRIFSVNWVYCLYIRDMLYPCFLGPDWSGRSIDLITSWGDPRTLLVITLWIVTLALVYKLLVGRPTVQQSSSTSSSPSSSPSHVQSEINVWKIVQLSFWSFTFVPFLLSSNLLVVVGLMKADRVIYLPLMGFCLLQALLFQTTAKRMGTCVSYIMHLLLLAQLAWYAALLHHRNRAWSSALHLWMEAYRINPKSHHTIYNCGYELSLNQRYLEAEQVLRPIADAHVEGPSNTFVYAMVLYNLNRCAESHEYINRALAVLQQKKEVGGPRNLPSALARVESNLLVARGFCISQTDLRQAGHVMYQAVQIDSSNEYAVQQATQVLQMLERQTQLQNQLQGGRGML